MYTMLSMLYIFSHLTLISTRWMVSVLSSLYTWINQGLVIYPGSSSNYVAQPRLKLVVWPLYFVNKLRSGKSCTACIGPTDSKKFGNDGAKVFSFKVSPIYLPFSKITETLNSPWWHNSFWLCEGSRLNHDIAWGIRGYGNRDLLLSHCPSSIERVLGWVFLNSVCQGLHLFWKLPPLPPWELLC